jgi:hypothetical protein
MLFQKLSILVPFENVETHLALTVAQQLNCQVWFKVWGCFIVRTKMVMSHFRKFALKFYYIGVSGDIWCPETHLFKII